jgi:aspartyl-tRNA(Asn)/glutamyl-tRNA(Gln) amidotransferase subunit B
MVKVPLDPSKLKSPLKWLRRAAETFPFLPPEMQPIIGLEIHVQLNTKRKLFSCTYPPAHSIDDLAAPISVDAAPNTMVGYHDIGLPGSLPVLNKEAVLLAVKAALAMRCTVNRKSSFDRKHYFYKDLATGYQITQRYRISPGAFSLI